MEQDKERIIRVGISHGDYNGIGYEIILKTFSDERMFDFCTPIIYGSSKLAAYYKKTIPNCKINFNNIKSTSQAIDGKLNILNIVQDEIKVEPGISTKEAGTLAFESLEAITQDIEHGIDVMVTAPINKDNIQSDNFKFPGHTEYLADKFGKDNELMVLTGETMNIAVVTGHIPIKDVAATITKELILKKLQILQNSLKVDFGIMNPRIAVLGINPHAGDNGLLGKEEQEIIIPAIEEAKENKMLAFGPFPSDGFFGSDDYTKFDGILAMYHDQGLLPFKSLNFEDGVNFTAGISIIRTSPDHGTGYNIAAKNIASPNSIRAAILMAVDVFKKRKEHKSLTKNPLKFSKIQQGRDVNVDELEKK